MNVERTRKLNKNQIPTLYHSMLSINLLGWSIFIQIFYFILPEYDRHFSEIIDF